MRQILSRLISIFTMKRNNKMEEREERQGSNRGAEEERNERMNTGFKKFKRWNGERDEVGKKDKREK